MRTNYFYKIVNSDFYFYLVNYGLVLALVFRFVWIIVTLILTFFFSAKLGYSNSYIFDAISVLVLFIYYSIINNTIRYCRQKLWVPIETVIYLVLITIFFFIMMSLNKNSFSPGNWNWLNITVITIQIGIRVFSIVFLFFYFLYWKQASIGAFFYRLINKNKTSFRHTNPVKKTITSDRHHEGDETQATADKNLKSRVRPTNEDASAASEAVRNQGTAKNSSLLAFKEMPGNSWFQLTNHKKVKSLTKLDFFKLATGCQLADERTVDHINEWEQFFLICAKTKLIIGVFKFHQSSNGRPMSTDVLDYFRSQSPALDKFIAQNQKALLKRLMLNIDFANNNIDHGIYKYQQFDTRKVTFIDNFGSKTYIIN